MTNEAAEMYAISNDAENRADYIDKLTVKKKIREAAERGMYSLSVKNLRENTVSHLKRLGYKVIGNTISWR